MIFFKKYIFIILLFLVSKIDAQEYTIKNFTIKDGLPSNIIFDIKQDKIGYLWIATEKGLVKYDGHDFTQITKQKTTTLFIDNQNVYAGVENGLFIKSNTDEKFLKSKKIQKIIRFKDEIIIGTIQGIYLYKNNKLQPLKINSAIDSSSINDIIIENSNIIICSSNGLFKSLKNLIKNNLKKIFKGNFLHIEKSYNNYITVGNGNIVSVVKGDSISKKISTLSDISSMKKIKNELWITSNSNGIEIFSLPSFSFKQKINKYNSLSTNTIFNVFKDRQNTIYLASNKGFYTLQKTPFKSLLNNNPVIHFENFQVNYKNVDSLLNSKKLKLSDNERNLAFSFKTINITNPKKIKYRYALNGNFSSWSTNNTVQFPKLNPGKYNFEVQSKIGNKKSLIKSFSFTIDAPFYKQAWFVFLVIIIFLIISYISVHYYIKKIELKSDKKISKLKLENRLLSLEQKALQLQMNPHFIFNVLNGIKALGNNGNKKDLNNTISQFSVLLRGILNNSRKEEITLAEEIKLLKNYIELEQRISSKSFSYNITTNLNNIDAEEILIPTMLIQPFVENCIQHAFEKSYLGEINISFNVKYRFLYCNIIDNGIGIHHSMNKKTSTNHKSVALGIARERLFAINSKSCFKIDEIIENKITRGTKVSFRIPLKTDY